MKRWFSLFGVKPNLEKTFKLSDDPFLLAKVRDIARLYLHPPDHALVLCVDVKTWIQELSASSKP